MSEEDYATLINVSPVLTNERLSDALTKWFAENFTFTHWEYVGETGKGDSYLSELIRIKIHGKNQNGESKYVQVILKTIPMSLSRRLTFRSDEFFRNEINFYEIVLPALLKFQASKNVTEPFTNYAKLFFSYCDGTNDVLCLEDASTENFVSAVRQEGIDVEHCKLTFKTLAQYHAMSIAMKEQEPKKFDVLKNTVFETYYDDRLWDWYERFWEKIFELAIDAVEREYPNTHYIKEIKQLSDKKHYKDMIKATRTHETGVISHGDCWTNNFLYKYENGKPVDAKLIDLQLTRCASPVLDITFVIYACTTQDMRLKHYDDLLKYYYEVLARQVKEMGTDPEKVYSLNKFMEEVKKYSYFGLIFSFESTPFIILDPEDAINMEMEGDQKMNIADVWRLKPIKTKEGRLREANNVIFCVDRGYIPITMSEEDYTTLVNVCPALTKERLSNALTKWFAENFTFTHWENLGGFGKGDSYLSELMRIKIHGKNQNGESKYVQVILKTIPKSVASRLTFRSDEFFRNEINFYEIVLPALLKFQASKNVTEPFTNYAKLLLSYSDGTNDVLCLEDATTENFGSAVRQEGIDVEHCKLTFKTLAQFHAMSIAMKAQKPQEFDALRNAIFETYCDDRLWDWYERFWEMIFAIAIDAVEKEYPNTHYVEVIRELSDKKHYKDMVKAATRTYETGVITQGDCWTNNFLYKYQNGKPVDSKLIDFQTTRCASPALDISFVIYACTTQDMRLKHYDDLLQYYYEVLARQVKEMGTDPEKVYSKETFMDNIKKYSYFGIIYSFESTPCIILDPEDAFIVELEGDQKMNIADVWKLEPIKTKEGRLRVANNLVFGVDRGYIPKNV
ncbi:uncharacterized protein LOC113227327 [Hyposmocoma kahamanoa]|uniref:uncharacterized protein LOC113227327 n=1 Tax=Hyposmocoma kahamanoa TaxID=1477025 RepID=UPI000E6D7EBA|nr:uncharacterized protein LOC113227327 [Hyposmocoma kahamanoa]